MTKANVFTDNFMNNLEANDFVKDNQPNKGPEMDTAFIAEQLSSYTRLLKSGIIEKTTHKEKDQV